MRTPPTALTNTSWSNAAMPAWRCSTASSSARRCGSSPTDSRRGFGACAVSTSAWISTSSGRVPSCVTSTHDPGTGLAACAATGTAPTDWRRPCSPRSVIANTPSSLTAPKRFLIARTRRKVECVSPSKYSTVSTMCSSTRGPASAPSLVTWPIEHEAHALLLGHARQLGGALAHLGHRARRRLQLARYSVWIESMTATTRLLVAR